MRKEQDPASEQNGAEYIARRIDSALRRKAYREIRKLVDEIEQEQRLDPTVPTPPRAERRDPDAAEYIDPRILDALRRRAYGEIRKQIDEIESEQRSQKSMLITAVLGVLGLSVLIAYAVYSYYR